MTRPIASEIPDLEIQTWWKRIRRQVSKVEQDESTLGVLPLLAPGGVAHAEPPAVPDPKYILRSELDSSPMWPRSIGATFVYGTQKINGDEDNRF